MGNRSRRDPAGHQVRGKGAPTETAEQNLERETEGVEAPAPLFIFFPSGFTGQFSAHPRLGDLLDLGFIGPAGAQALVRMPPAAWPALKQAIEQIFEERDTGIENPQMTRSGIHLPGGVDIDKEAAAFEELKKGEQHGPPAN